jgi:hypothetical protein
MKVHRRVGSLVENKKTLDISSYRDVEMKQEVFKMIKFEPPCKSMKRINMEELQNSRNNKLPEMSHWNSKFGILNKNKSIL